MAGLAISIALTALPAFASAASFTSSSYPYTASGVTWGQEFQLEAGTVECKTNLIGSGSEASPTLTLTPTYTECKAFGYVEASVNMNGCDYVFHASGQWDISCSGSNKVVINAVSCEVQIGSQSGLAPVSFSNSGAGIWAGPETSFLSYTVTKDGFLCPFNGTGARTGGDYVSVVNVFLSRSGGGSISVDP